MGKQGIKFLALNTDDDEVQFQIQLDNGINSTSIDFYGYIDTYNDFATGLISFPKTIKDIVSYELGEIGDKWAYYILLKVYCFEVNGHTAIKIVVDNNGKAPYINRSEFYITTVPASINELGKLLRNWNPKVDKEIEWIAE
jgi:hypothetical protein